MTKSVSKKSASARRNFKTAQAKKSPTTKISDLELPLGRRTPLYRFFEILPGALSYTLIILLFVISIINPTLGAIYLLIMLSVTLIKAIGTAFRTIQGFKTINHATAADWRRRYADLSNPHAAYERLHSRHSDTYEFDQHLINLKKMSADPQQYPDPSQIYHAVIMTVYNENLDIVIPTVEAVKKNQFDHQKIIFVVAYEERGGAETEKTVQTLRQKYRSDFYDFILIKHPKNLKNEVVGKGPNLTYAGHELQKYVQKKKLPVENIIVTTLDADNRMHKKYLPCVAYEFVVSPRRQHMSFQPVSLFMNNIWDAPAPTRVVAITNSFFNTVSTMRPHVLRNFASHSQPLQALEQMDFWSKRTIVEDGHQFWRSLFFFNGDYSVLPIRVPIYQDAVIDDTFGKTLKAQFIQLRRWDYGASDIAYVAVRLFNKKRTMPFVPLFTKFMRLFDGHVMLAVMAPVVGLGGWVPLLMNLGSSNPIVFTLPGVVAIIQTVAMIGLVVTIWTSMRMIPERPVKYKKQRSLWMVLQWVLMPIIAICYQSAAAFYAQTRLMTGHYMEKFDVTKKVVKK